MTPNHPPLALSEMDILDAEALLVRSCEDCACPVSGTRHERVRAELPQRGLVAVRNAFEFALDAEHTVLFSPSGNGGVVVLNEAGIDVFRRLAQPTTPAELPEAGDVLRTLLANDLIHPVGEPPAPHFTDSEELTAWLHVTNKCNLRCPYCYVHKTDDEMTGDLARESVDALVDSALRHGFRALRLKYAGGEASLNPHVVIELHDHAQARCDEAGLRLSAVLLSNGVAIRPAFAARLKERGIRVMVSLDGIGAGHDAQRPTLGGKPSSALVLRTIDALRDTGIDPHLSITITARNVDAVAEVVRFALDRDLTFSFNFFRDNECSASVTDLRYDESTMVAGLRSAFAVIEELLPRWSVLGSVLDRGQLLEPRQRSCGVGDDYVVIDQAGRIAKCHMEIGDTIGDIRDTDPVHAIRTSPVGVKNLLVQDKAGCRDCTWRNWCSGGCAAATFRATGRYDVQSPNCNIYRAIYPDAVRLEGLRVLRYAGR